MPIDVGLAKIDAPRLQFDGYVTAVDIPVEDDRYPYLRLATISSALNVIRGDRRCRTFGGLSLI
jgi:hypothetical protein